MTSKGLRKPSESLVRTLSDNIIRLRQVKGLSQEELAENCGLHRTYIGSVERGERNVTLSTLEALAIALDVPITTLLTRPEDDRPSPSLH
jgi:transcriptional regulator with XRE-family HTH domain